MIKLTTHSSWMAFRDALEAGQDFDTSGALKGRSGGYMSRGILPQAHWFTLDSADYVVYSYSTPIAWHTDDDGWVIPDVKYSATTSRHQSKISTAISQLDEYPRKDDSRTVWACCESTIGPKCQHLASA